MQDLEELRRRAAGCTACELYADATQTVFGAGRPGARIVLAGEQPGDKEDEAGEPFVGPAGHLLDRALERAGVGRGDAYLTNVVKHFRFRREGKRRIHRTPGVEHVRACLPWLESELATVRPRLLVTLGATAAKALLGSSFRLTSRRAARLRGTAAARHGAPFRCAAGPQRPPGRGVRGAGGRLCVCRPDGGVHRGEQHLTCRPDPTAGPGVHRAPHHRQAVAPSSCTGCLPSANSSTIFAQKAGRSSGLRLETRPWSVTTSWSTTFAPALRRSVRRLG